MNSLLTTIKKEKKKLIFFLYIFRQCNSTCTQFCSKFCTKHAYPGCVDTCCDYFPGTQITFEVFQKIDFLPLTVFVNYLKRVDFSIFVYFVKNWCICKNFRKTVQKNLSRTHGAEKEIVKTPKINLEIKIYFQHLWRWKITYNAKQDFDLNFWTRGYFPQVVLIIFKRFSF